MLIDELSISGGNIELVSGTIEFNTYANFNAGSSIENKLIASGDLLWSRDADLQSQVDNIILGSNAYLQTQINAISGEVDLLQSGQVQLSDNVDYLSGVLYMTGGISGAVYNNANPTTVTVGGIPAGTTFTNKTFQEIIDMLLYPYQSPSFSSFSISSQSTSIEVGDIVSGVVRTFNWSTTNSSNVSPNTIIIKDVTSGNIVLGTGLANDGSESLSLINNIIKTTATSHTWSIEATNTQSGNFNTNFSVSWRWRYYWGFYSGSTINSAQTLALQSSILATAKGGSFTLPTNPGGLNYIYFVYPNSFGALTSIYDNTNGFNVTTDFTNLGTITVTNTYSVDNTYTVYRSINAVGGASGDNYTLT